MVLPTPSQTVGPFFRFGFAWLSPSRHLVPAGSPGAIDLHGTVSDALGPVPDAVVEIWQADAGGGFPPHSPGAWTGFGRSLTAPDGGYDFTTVSPGRVDGRQAPHIDVSVFARGLLQRLVTRIYLPDEAANATDPVLTSVDADRRDTLIARPDGTGLGFDIHLRGADETVFFQW